MLGCGLCFFGKLILTAESALGTWTISGFPVMNKQQNKNKKKPFCSPHSNTLCLTTPHLPLPPIPLKHTPFTHPCTSSTHPILTHTFSYIFSFKWHHFPNMKKLSSKHHKDYFKSLRSLILCDIQSWNSSVWRLKLNLWSKTYFSIRPWFISAALLMCWFAW